MKLMVIGGGGREHAIIKSLKKNPPVETIFALPGLGQLFYAAVMARDYPLIMGNLVLGAVLTLLGNMLADLGYSLADPRIRHSAQKGGRA